MAALSLFYSYAREDEALRDQLEMHLVQLQRQGLISTWHEREIPAGGMRADEIDKHLETASIILLLVSPDFLASDYCYENEMKRALERYERGEARVVPIILRHCDWQHTPLKDLQCLPRNGRPVVQWQDRDEVFSTIIQSLRRIVEQQHVVHSPVPLSPLNRENCLRMLRSVRTIWVDGLLAHSLHQAVEIELHLQDRPDVLANPWRLQVQELNQAPQTLPAGTSIVQVYDRAEGELLILGEPGAGKTTLLLELARALLERAMQNEQLRMPIVFHLSSWAEKRQSLRTWLIDELSTKYHIPHKIGQSWVDADQILPLLDGLDEVAKDACSACVEQINEYYQSRLERGSSPIVVCCRSEEYTALPTRIQLQNAVGILPLTDEQINAYLEQAGEQVKGLTQVLNEDPELHSLARQPLMLNIFTLAYQGATAAEVPTGETLEEARDAIFARYVERMLGRRVKSRRWRREQVMQWLAFLAKQMRRHEQSVFLVEGLQPSWLSRRWRVLYRWCVGLIDGLVSGLGFVLFCKPLVWLLPGLSNWLLFGLLVGLPFGLGFGQVFWLLVVLDRGINPAETLTWSWRDARFGLVDGLLLWLFIGLLFVPLGGLVFGLLFGLPFGLVFGPFVGLLAGLICWLPSGLSRKQLPERLFFSPNEGIWRSGKNGLVVGLLIGLIIGLLTGAIFELYFKLLLGPIFGLLIGTVFSVSFWLFLGLCLGLSFGLEAFVKHFTLRFFLARRGDLPWDLVAFLDEAAQRLLLRKVGGSYVFAHRLLLQYFAELEEEV